MENTYKKKIKVLIFVPIPNMFPDKYLWKIWELIVKTGNLDCEYIKVKFPYDYGNTRVNSRIETFIKSDADILVGDYFINSNNIKHVDYTRSLLYQQPVLLYKKSYKMNNNFFKFKNTLITFENSLKLMIVPMLIFIILGCIMGFLLFSSNKKSGLKWAFIQTYGSLLGAHDVIISKSNPNNNINFIVSILILIISFFFIIYLTARLTAFQIKNNYYEDPFSDSIAGKKIAVNGDIAFKDIQLRGGIPVRYPEEYTNRKQIDKFLKSNEDGIVIWQETVDNSDLHYILNHNKSLAISDYKLTQKRAAFVVKKNKCKLYETINDIISVLHDKQEIYKVCTETYPQMKSICLKNFLL